MATGRTPSQPGGGLPMASKPNPPREYQNLECEFEGKTYSGTYYVAGEFVHVSCRYDSKSAHLGALTPATLARQLLSEIIGEAKKSGRLDRE